MGKNDFCCAPGCSNNRKRNPSLQFYRIPKETTRRKAWLQRIRRQEFTPTNNTRLCSEHFIGGVKSNYPHAQGFTPSIFKHAHCNSKAPRSSNSSSVCDLVENIDALHKPKWRKLSQGNEVRGRPKRQICPIEDHWVWGQCLPLSHCLKEHDYIRAQVDPVSLTVDKSIIDEMSLLYKKIAHLEEENHILRTKCLNLAIIKEDDEKFQRYTGFPNYATFKALFDFLDSVVLQKKKNWRGSEMDSKVTSEVKEEAEAKLSLEEEFFMVLLRLRCGLTLSDLALRYSLCESSVSRIFTNWINLLYVHLKELCQTPDYCDALGKAEQFSSFPDWKVIVDCTEIFTQKPSCLKANKEVYSNYKSHTVFTFLVAINPCAAVAYVSQGWGERALDKYITTNSADFIAILEERDEVMADGGFDIGDVLGQYGVKVSIPEVKGQERSQLKKLKAKRSREMVEARIHVERVIQRIKTYRILDREVRLSMAHLAEQIFTVCAYLVNFQAPILK